MAKALVIKGVDFSTNKLTTVTLIEEIPCASISLNSDELTMANIGTANTLVATVLPANTTDRVSWSTSNARIVSVNENGVVTVRGAGTAVITATCGTKTAQCIVTTTHTLTMSKEVNSVIIGKPGTSGMGTKNAVVAWNADNGGHYAMAYQVNQLDKGIYNASEFVPSRFPIYFGHASTLTITAPNSIRVTAVITDSTVSPDGSDAQESRCAMWLQKDASNYDTTVPLGNRVITDIPNAADSVGLCFQKPDTSGGNISLEDIASITVVAS